MNAKQATSRQVRSLSLLTALLICSSVTPVMAMDDQQLREITQKRLAGDRTNACFAVAVVEKTVSRAYVCANDKNTRGIGADSAFEIGSVSKTMTATLLADLILQGKASLDDPLQNYLPKGVKAPGFNKQPILLKHLVAHTSGLPVVPDFSDSALDNPYAKVDEKSLYKTLSTTKLARAPGNQFEYSNYASMLLSLIVAKRAGQDFESLLRERVFTPLSMRNAYINQKPDMAQAVQGHTPNAKPTSAWTFQTNAAGVGGVRATLDDMVSYAQAQLAPSESELGKAIALTQQRVTGSGNPNMGMNWMIAPLNGREILAHEGGTGGFSSFVAIDKTKQRAVIVLSDTALTNTGGLGSLGLHLLDSKISLGKPRVAQSPAPELLTALIGRYKVMPGLEMNLTVENNKLYTQATGQEKFEMGYDSAGDFYPLEFDAILRPKKLSNGSYQLSFLQGGGVMPMQRIEKNSASAEKLDLAEYTGKYPLAPGFVLSIFAEGDVLKAQATGQGAFPIMPAGKDVFTASEYDIEIRFQRNKQGKVDALNLLQAGRDTPARKQ